MTVRAKRRQVGLLFDERILTVCFVLVCFLVLGQFAGAQGGAVSPDPAPTDAVKMSGQRLQATGKADLEQGPGPARYAALLEAHYLLLSQALSRGLVPGNWSEDGQLRFFRVDSDHPNPELVSWLAQARVTDERIDKEEKTLVLESPSLGTLAAALPNMRATYNTDVDRDGTSDVISLGYDGRLYLLKNPSQRESKIVARSPSFALLEMTSGPGFHRFRSHLPLGIEDVEGIGGGQARAVLKFESLEMVNGRLLGRAEELREVIMALEGTEERIRFSLSRPTDFAQLNSGKAEIQGNTISEKILEDVSISHNGELAWESPQSLGIRALNFNLARELKPGWNHFRITARDKEGFARIRELWVEKREQAARDYSRAKRAVLVTKDKKFRAAPFQQALVQAGFQPQMISILRGNEATVENTLAALGESRGAQELFFYCESLSRPGDVLEGKSLILQDQSFTPSDLAQALNGAGYSKVLGVFQTELQKQRRNDFRTLALWRDTTTLLERLSGPGRLFLANVEDPKKGGRKARKRSRERLLQALQGRGELTGLLAADRPWETVFRGWMFGAGVLD